jgi:hypothetical protein
MIQKVERRQPPPLDNRRGRRYNTANVTKNRDTGGARTMMKKILTPSRERHNVHGGNTDTTPVLLWSGHADLTASRSVIYNTLSRQG